jgi:hypothetical protein
LPPLLLKSVAYQPLPFNWNPASGNELTNVDAAGRQAASGGSKTSATPRARDRRMNNDIS